MERRNSRFTPHSRAQALSGVLYLFESFKKQTPRQDLDVQEITEDTLVREAGLGLQELGEA